MLEILKRLRGALKLIHRRDEYVLDRWCYERSKSGACPCFGCGKKPDEGHKEDAWYTVWQDCLTIQEHCAGDLCPGCQRKLGIKIVGYRG